MVFYKCILLNANIVLLKNISILIYFAKIFIICFLISDININIHSEWSRALNIN